MTNEQLVARIKAGIDTAENMLELWQQNRGLIGKIAAGYKGYEDMDDLRQQGYIGLCSAVENYRAGEAVPFANYAALWIRQSMTRYIENNGKLVRIPVHESGRQLKYKRFVREFEAGTGRKPDELEICRYLEISPDQLEALQESIVMGNIGSLDNYVGEDKETTLGDLVAGDVDVEGQAVADADAELLQKILWPIVDALPGKRGTVLRARYQEGITLKETGERIGVTTERVRVMEKEGLRDIRRSRNARLLHSFLEEDGEIYSRGISGTGAARFGTTWTSATERVAMEIHEGNRTPLVTS